ncbi:MAG TPA: RDD family protein [Polyangia bacterium]
MECPRCTAPVDPGVQVCPDCGAALAPGPDQEAQGAGAPAGAPEGSVRGPGRAAGGEASPGRGREPEVVRFRVAGFFERALAGLVDALIVMPIFVLLAWGGSAVTGVRVPPARELNLDLVVGLLVEKNGPIIFWSVLLAILVFLYCFIFVGTRGQTPGKRLLGVRVVTWYGEPPSLARALLRTCGYLLSAALLSLGFIWIGFDREKRGLHDWIAGTYVVRS